MMWRKQAEQIIDAISDINMSNKDLDDIGYYVVHLSSPIIWKRTAVLADAMSYYATTMATTNKERMQEEQLWLPFDQ